AAVRGIGPRVAQDLARRTPVGDGRIDGGLPPLAELRVRPLVLLLPPREVLVPRVVHDVTPAAGLDVLGVALRVEERARRVTTRRDRLRLERGRSLFPPARGHLRDAVQVL